MIQFVANDKEVIWGGGNGLSKDSEKDPRENPRRKLRSTEAEGYVGKESCIFIKYYCVSR